MSLSYRRLLSISALGVFLASSSAGTLEAQNYVAPPAGSVYKEFARVIKTSNPSEWRVTHSTTTNTSAQAFLPNPVISFSVSDLAGAVRAEAVIDLWGGHVGTTGKKMRLNGNAWITIPELTTTPTSGQCYLQQTNVVVNVPLSHLIQGTNTLEGDSGNQSCYSFNWGQWGWYSILLRVYYNASKPHPTGSITSPANGASIGENPTISATATGGSGVNRVDFFAYYDGYDTDGDGVYQQYHENYHRLKTDTTIVPKNHAGTDTTSPYSVTWDTTLVPDQAAGSVKVLARIRDTSGVWFVTDEVTGLSLSRPGTAVKLYKPTNAPESFWVRRTTNPAGWTKTCNFTIPAGDVLANATSAKMLIKTWNGVDGQAESGQPHWYKINNWTVPVEFGQDHYYAYDVVDVSIASALQNGTNTFEVHSESTHHGIEVIWPGPAFLVRYNTGPATPPPAPTGLVATAISSSQVNLDWADNPPAGLQGYHVYRSTTSGFTPSAGNRIASNVAVSAYTDNDVVGGTTYFYKVIAVNTSNQESSPSAQAQATTPVDNTPPTIVSATALSSQSVSVLFSESLHEPTAETTGNYSITRPGSSVTVNTATLQADGRTVVLATGVLTPDVTYTLGAVGVRDLAPSPNSSNDTETFVLPGAPVTLYSENFNSLALNSDPANWRDTAANNSMTEQTSLFKVLSISSQNAFGTTSTSSNIHSHYVGSGASSLANYEFTGRIRMTSTSSGIGVTLLSDYPVSDKYSRLRRYDANGVLTISPHGTSMTGGTTSLGVTPAINTWYRFRVQAQDTGSQTQIRARVWQDGTTEPSTWQADCFDSSATRRTAGTFGVWSHGAGSKYWDDMVVTSLSGGGSGPRTLTVNVTGSGSVAKSPNLAEYTDGQSVTLTATPAAGWLFSGWSGDLTGAANPATITMTSNKTITATFQQSGATDWWDNGWDYRVPVSVNANGFDRTDKPAVHTINFTPLLQGLGASGAFDPSSLRVHEVNGSGQITALNVPFQFDPASNYNASTNATGALIILLGGSSGASSTRTFHVYFDVTGKGFTPASVAAQVVFTDNVTDVGLNCYRIQTLAGTYFYDKLGGGFSSINDASGNDWLNYNSTPGAAGTYRGMPNAVYPESHFHPGFTTSNTTLLGQGPLRVMFRSTTTDNKWECTWEIFPRHATMVMTKRDHNFWFLYEGTPGGSFDLTDTVVRSNGTSTALSGSWNGDLSGQEWVYFADAATTRSLFAAHHQEDSTLDSYRDMEDIMTVFGFGRQSTSPTTTTFLSTVPQTFTVGLIDTTTFSQAAPLIRSAYKDLSITQAAAQARGGSGSGPFTLTINLSGSGSVSRSPNLSQYNAGTNVTLTASAASGWTFNGWSGAVSGTTNPITVTMDSNKTVTATFVPSGSFSLNVTVNGSGSVAKSPDQAAYTSGQSVTLTATPAAGWTFSGWSGSISGTGNPINFVISSNMNVTATFTPSTQHTVNVTVSGSGTVTKNPNQATYNPGQQVTLTATPSSGWSFSGWSGGASGTTNPLTITVNSNVSITATFTQSTTFTLSVTVSGTGSVSKSPDKTSYNSGEQVTLTATPGSGWSFGGWSGTVSSVSNPLVLTMNSNHSQTALFFSSTAIYDQNFDGMAVNSDPPSWYDNGPGFAGAQNQALFKVLSVSGTNAFGTTNTGFNLYSHYNAAGSNTLTDYEISGRVRFTDAASGIGINLFSGYPSTADRYYQIRKLATQNNFRAGAWGGPTFTGGDTTSSPVLSPNVWYRFRIQADDSSNRTDIRARIWQDGNSEPATWDINCQDTSAGRLRQGTFGLWAYGAGSKYWDDLQVISLNGGGSSPPPSTLTINTSGSGSVSRNPNLSSYAFGQTVTLTATPASGWVFSGWSGDLSGTANPSNIVMTSNKTVTATFTQPSAAPVISDIAHAPGTTTATITWTTDIPATTVVDYGLTSSYGQSVQNSSLVLSHSIQVTGLSANTLYNYRVRSASSGGQSSSSTNRTFTTQSASSNVLVSDDFNRNNLDTTRWTWVDPRGDSRVRVTGAGTSDARVEIIVPGGVTHDLSTANHAPRILQTIDNTNFTIEAKFLSPLTQNTVGQGIVVQGTGSNNLVRFDFFSNGTTLRLFAASLAGSTFTAHGNTTISQANPLWMRVTRSGNTWTQQYSTNGTSWNNGASFTHTLTANAAGVFALNFHSTASSTPAHTAQIDYVFNGASPLGNEDGVPPGSDAIVPFIHRDEFVETTNSVTFTWATDEVADRMVEYGLTSSYELGDVEQGTLSNLHNLAVNGLSPNTQYHFRVSSQDGAGNSASETYVVSTLAPGGTGGPSIDIWYGPVQEFGHVGTPQTWVDILGNVSDPNGVSSLTYRLNGGSVQQLSRGPNLTRLEKAGDFNANLDINELNPGLNTLEITARDTLNNTSIETVTIDFEESNTWPLPYSINWSTVTNLQDVAQVIDGDWIVGGGVLRNVDRGYDRIVAIGDIDWVDYEILVPIRVNSRDPAALDRTDCKCHLIGVILRWTGHVAWGTTQPEYGFYPLGAQFGYWWQQLNNGNPDNRLFIGGNESISVGGFSSGDGAEAEDPNFVYQEGVTYMYRARVQTKTSGGSRYMFKLWLQGSTEPSSWNLQIDSPENLDPPSGSALLFSHYIDASFGNVTITPLSPIP